MTARRQSKGFDQDKADERKDAPALQSFGVTGLKHSSGYLDEEWHPKLKGNKARKKYREMVDNSAIIATALWITEVLARQVEWEVKPAESDHPLVDLGAEFAESLFADMETPWKQTVSEIMSMQQYGFSLMEPEYKLRRGDQSEPVLHSKFTDGLIGWRDWSPRSQDSVERWIFDPNGRVIGVTQRDPNDGKLIPIHMDRLLHFKIRARKGNPEGRSLLRSVYRAYYRSMNLEDIQTIGVERNVAGLPDYQVPRRVIEGKDADAALALASAKNLVKKIRVDQYSGIVRPAEQEGDRVTGYKFQLISSSGKSFADTVPIIQASKTEIAQALMTEFTNIGTAASTSGSYSAHSDKTAMLAMAIGSILDIIEDVTNEHALPGVFNLNNIPRDALPTWEHGDIEKAAILETTQAVAQAVQSGAMDGDESVNNMLRQLFELPEAEGRPLAGMLQDAAMGSRAVQAPVASDPDVSRPGQQPVPGQQPEPMELEEQDDGPEWWTVEEASETLGVSTNVIRSAIRRGQLPGVPVGRTFRINRKKMMAWLESGVMGQ